MQNKSKYVRYNYTTEKDKEKKLIIPPDPKSEMQALRNGIRPYSKAMDNSASLLCSYKYTSVPSEKYHQAGNAFNKTPFETIQLATI